MFVSSNKLSALKSYFYQKLELQFSPSELKFLFYDAVSRHLNIPTKELLLNPEFRLSESDLLAIRQVVHQLLDHKPYQYIVGSTEFYGLELKCDSRALIPRPETEELVAYISNYPFINPVQSIIDVCTGSGCIALALKKTFPQAAIVGLDISPDAIHLANENAQQTALDVTFNVHDFLTDSFSNIHHKFDVIVSNPPYIPFKEKSLMESNVLEYEPHLALFVEDEDPLVFYRNLALFAHEKLHENGILVVEINERLHLEVENLFKENGLKNVQTIKDLQGKHRIVKAEK